jgi:predicted nucleic acid-binding protein
MRMSVDASVVFDTNVLVYALDTDAPQCEAAKAACDAAASGQFPASITTQVVLEYVSIVTSAKRVAVPSTLAEAWDDVRRFLEAFTLITLRPEDMPQVAALSEKLELSGPKGFDLAIAVTALGAGIDTVCTYDSSIFARVPGLKVVEP